MTPFRAWLVLAVLVVGGGREGDSGLGLRCVSSKEQISNLCKYKPEAGNDGDKQHSHWKCGGIASSKDLEKSLRFDVKPQDVKQCIRMSTMQGPIGCGGNVEGACIMFVDVYLFNVWFGWG